jgi:integrase/recombinase XerD
LATVYRRGRVYWVRFRADGHHVRRSAHTSKKAEAIAFLQRLLAEHAAKARGDRPRHRYEEAAERFLAEANIKPKTRACYTSSDRACRATFESRHLDEIDRRLLGEFVSKRKSGGVSDTTIRRDLAFVSSMCAMAARWGWLDTNPVTSFSKRTLKEARPRTRFLTHAEYDALLANAADHVRPAITLAVETGLRKEELFSLTVSAIDLSRREIPARPDQERCPSQRSPDGCRPRHHQSLAGPAGTTEDAIPIRQRRRQPICRHEEGIQRRLSPRKDRRYPVA